jgi:hypothetical protein
VGVKTTREIADFVCKTGFEHFSSEVVSYTKKICLRHLGMNLAGADRSIHKVIHLSKEDIFDKL